ncbi:MAG: LptF/LptG family permease [Acidobacteriia bacterium]|nr:LptF/LptG family permease [Terriglobia bacterium]
MRILTRYILKEICAHSLLGLLVFTFVIFLQHVSHLLELAVRHSLPPASTITLFLLPVPGILVLTVPMAVLVGTLIGLSRMSADGEVIATRAAGIGMGQFIRPVMVLALAGWGLATWMSLVLAPQSLQRLHRMEQEISTSEVPYEIQPRVFVEQFPNLLLYLQDVTGSRSRWLGVFIADTTSRNAPKVTLAERGMLVNDRATRRLTLHLEHGATHEIDPEHPERYSVATFTDTDLPIPLERGEGTIAEWRKPPALGLKELLKDSRNPALRQASLVELNYRFALPFASLVLTLVGIPLGLSSRKGGWAVGGVLTILIVFVYYILMAFGLGFAKQGRLNPFVGLWLANGLFGAAGVLMLSHLRRVRLRIQFLQDWIEEIWRKWRRRLRTAPQRPAATTAPIRPEPHAPGQRFFQILDLYVIRGWLLYFLLLLVAFNYYRFLLPQAIYYPALPLSVLVATLVNFGLLAKTNQITAIKSAGVSVYRLSVPILLAAAALSAGMYLLGDYYLPETNQRQDALRNQIKGKPPQTYYRPDRQWIFGQGSRLYNYRFFDPDHNVFADLSAFEFDPQTFRLTRRIYAARAFWEAAVRGWVLENGWVRDLSGDRVTAYMPFSVAKFDELNEEPQYFKKEVKPSAQMSAWELRSYINELAQSGFDVVRLSVQLYRKFSFPLIAFVVALIGIPFSLTTGAKGALSGIALSIAIAIVYWSVSSLFEAMGNLSQLPPVVAAWSPDVLFGLGGVYFLLRVKT